MVLYTSSVVLIALGWILHHQPTEGCVSKPWEHDLVSEDVMCFNCPSGHYLECDEWDLEMLDHEPIEPAFLQACGIRLNSCSTGRKRHRVYLGPRAIYELRPTSEFFFKANNCGLTDVSISIYPQHKIDNIDLHLQNNEIVDLDIYHFRIRSDHLRTLNMSGNLLETLSSDLNQPYIQVADFGHNNIQLVETGYFSKFAILRWLSLANNNLTAVPKLNLQNTSQTTVILKGNAISTIEDNAFENVMFDLLDLSDNLLTNITGVFNVVGKINTLQLRNNLIFTLEQGCFDVAGISILDLSGNFLVTVSPDVFSYQPYLTSLVLSNNRLEWIGSKGEFYFPRLELLDLSHNVLRNFTQETFEHLDSLRRLVLSFNRIVVEEDSFRWLRLWHLDLSGNPIHNLEGSVFERTRVTQLDVSNCGLMEFPTDVIQELKYRLREVNLSRNLIRLIENGSLADTRISVLDLSGNSLITIPRNVFSNLPAVRFLTLSSNTIQFIEGPDVFDKCASLEHLDLSNNSLVNIASGTFKELTSLRRLLLSSNKIITVGADSFDGLRLNVLDLANNPIQIIEGTSFTNTQVTHLNISSCDLLEFPSGVVKTLGGHLRAANLSRNRITTFASLHFDEAIQLESLDLSHNSIDSVNCFRSVGSLQNLYLDNNAISDIERCLSTGIMFSTTVFSLRHNPLDCCELLWLHNVTSKAKTLLDADNTTCTTLSGEYFWPDAFVNTIGECSLIDRYENTTKVENSTTSTDDNSATIAGAVVGTFFGTIALHVVIALTVCFIRGKRSIKPTTNKTGQGAQPSATSVDEATRYETVEMPNSGPNIYDQLQERSVTTTEGLQPEQNRLPEGDYENVPRY